LIDEWPRQIAALFDRRLIDCLPGLSADRVWFNLPSRPNSR